MEGTEAQKAPCRGSLLLYLRLGLYVKHHRVLVERRKPAWPMPLATVLSFRLHRADSLGQGLRRPPWRGQLERCELETVVLPSLSAEPPNEKIPRLVGARCVQFPLP